MPMESNQSQQGNDKSLEMKNWVKVRMEGYVDIGIIGRKSGMLQPQVWRNKKSRIKGFSAQEKSFGWARACGLNVKRELGELVQWTKKSLKLLKRSIEPIHPSKHVGNVQVPGIFSTNTEVSKKIMEAIGGWTVSPWTDELEKFW